jgi:hypothetical protein
MADPKYDVIANLDGDVSFDADNRVSAIEICRNRGLALQNAVRERSFQIRYRFTSIEHVPDKSSCSGDSVSKTSADTCLEKSAA